MTGKPPHYSLAWRIICCIAALFVCACSSEKSETAKTGEQTGGRVTSKFAESTGPAGSVSSTPPGGKGGKTGPDALSGNNPKVDSARFLLETVNGIDFLKVRAEGRDKDGNKVSLRYEWMKNNEPAGEGDTISGFKRGDKISVKIMPFDDKGDGPAKALTTEIRNTTPKIVEHQQIKFDGKVWSYQVKALDADGDTLTYSLKSGPAGMTVNSSTGFISWTVPNGFKGKASATASVADGHGGESAYNFTVTVTP